MKQLTDFSSRFRILKGGKISLVVSALLGAATLSFAAPSGGIVTSGSATISQNGAVTNITQATNKASINWQSFSIASNETVNFNQPSASSITLNRVIGNERSVIEGAMNANGQVWLLNSNGVLFGKNASINTAGLLATTAKLSDEDFQAGNYNFTDATANSVINEGTITISDDGSVILASNEVRNQGTIQAVKGKVHLIGADSYSLNLNGNSLVNLKVDKGVLDAMVENSETIIADGGEIYLTTNAVDELLRGVVNNTGIIEANSLNGLTGKVELFAHGGTAEVDGTIEAEGGFVETSAKDLSVKSTAQIKTAHWLIDPENITISSAGEDDLSGDTVNATAIETALESADVELQAGEDITVNEDITWEEATKLTLNAGEDIIINSQITATNDDGQLALYYNSNDEGSDYYINSQINLKAGENFFTKDGGADEVTWTVITDLGSAGSTTGTDLQGINGNLTGNYVLGDNIDASDTSSWDNGKGFDPLGDSSTWFTGNFDGLGHTISNLTINRPDEDNIGLFGLIQSSIIMNVGILDGNIVGKNKVGGLVGANDSNAIIKKSYSTADVTGVEHVGGLVGVNFNIIKDSFSLGSVLGDDYVGGLVGGGWYANSNISNSYSTGEVIGYTGNNIGGFIGYNGGTITNSYWDAQTSGISTDNIDGTTAVYSNGGAETDAFSQAKYSGFDFTNDWVIIEGSTRPLLRNMYSTTITNAYQLQLMELDPTANYTLANDINFNILYTDSGVQTPNASGIWNTSTGFKPISEFTGTFDGQNYDITNLVIIRPDTDYVGLFSKIGADGKVSNIKTFSAYYFVGGNYSGIVAGSNEGTIENIKNAGGSVCSVGDKEALGGLVGINEETGIISNSGGAISAGSEGSSKTGSIAGINSGTITNSYSAISYLTFSNITGGLVGENTDTGVIKDSFTTGYIEGTTDTIGGLVGANYGTITNSHSGISSVDGHGVGSETDGGDMIGGLVGYNEGEISYSYSVHNVFGNEYVGGLVGQNNGGTITNSYSISGVNGSISVGGLVGKNINSIIKNSYFAGEASSSLDTAGGLIGSVSGTQNQFINSYYDKTLNPNVTDPGETGKTTAELQDIATFTTDITDEAARWDITGDDTLPDSYKYPILVTENGVTSWKIYVKTAPTPDPNPTPTPDPEPTPTPDPEPTPIEQEEQIEQIADIVTPILNGTRTEVNIPQIVTPQVTPTTKTIPNSLGLGANTRIVSTANIGEQADQIVSLGELQQTEGEIVRVPLSKSSIVDLVNGGVNLPEGVDQQFFVVSEKN